MFQWRATARERGETLPGDDLIPDAPGSSTHAITIAAGAEAVWPWLVQMGCDRAGFYSHDRLDNGGRPSARRILPQFQDTTVGDILPSRPGSPDGFEVLRMERPHLFLLGAYLRVPQMVSIPWDAPRPRAFVRSTWLFALREPAPGTTRLLVRARSFTRPRPLSWLLVAVMSPAHIVMQRRQLLNLRARAEGTG